MSHPPTHDSIADSTALFKGIYSEVTDAIDHYGDRLTHAEKEWLRYLVRHFYDRFERWNHGSAKSYLQRLDVAAGSGWRGRVLRLLGQVYLHIGLDLPLVIADSLQDPQVKIPATRAQDIFQDLNPLFREVFIKVSKDVRYAGWRGYVLRWSDRSRSASSLLRLLGTDRVLLWRNAAWINGESLAESTIDRRTREDVLRRSFETIATAVMRGSKSSVVWLDGLEPPWTVADSFDTPIYTRRGSVVSTREIDRPDDFLD